MPFTILFSVGTVEVILTVGVITRKGKKAASSSVITTRSKYESLLAFIFFNFRVECLEWSLSCCALFCAANYHYENVFLVLLLVHG